MTAGKLSPKAKIMVVDDTPANLDLIADILSEHDFHVMSLPSGARALSLAKRKPPDLVLLDINMPEMNGYEVCRELKANENTRDIPVIFISALEETMDKVKAFSCGGVDYVTKPFQVDEMLARVHTHLNIYRLQQQLEKNNQQLKQAQAKQVELAHEAGMATSANQTKSQFINTMSHELRTPMNGIMGLIDVILATDPNEDQKIFLDEMKLSANRLLSIINDVLDFSTMSSGEEDVVAVVFQIEDIINQLHSSFTDQIEQKGLALIVDTPKIPPLIGDLSRLERVLNYLMTNAIKFTEKGTISVDSEIIQQTDVQIMLRFRVNDTGIGIDNEQITKIFEPFYQVDASITRQQGGTGLGLSIAKQLVEAMGGEIGVESHPEQGSRFYFSVRFDLSEE